jgi:hypothetical protein
MVSKSVAMTPRLLHLLKWLADDFSPSQAPNGSRDSQILSKDLRTTSGGCTMRAHCHATIGPCRRIPMMTMARAGALWCTLSHQRIQFALSPPPILILARRFDRQFILPLSLQRRVLCVSHLLPNLVLHPQTPLTSKWRKSPMCSSRSMPMLSLARLWYVFAYSVPNARTYSHLFINLYSTLPLAPSSKRARSSGPTRPSPIFIADFAAGPSLNPNILDHFRCNPSDDRDPSSVRQELLSTVQAQYWRQRYRAALDDVAAIRERREEYYSKYTITLEEILKISMESGV